MHIQGNLLVQELLLKVSDTCINNIDILSMCMKKRHAKKFLLLLNNCFSNLAILYGFCLLNISFLY